LDFVLGHSWEALQINGRACKDKHLDYVDVPSVVERFTWDVASTQTCQILMSSTKSAFSAAKVVGCSASWPLKKGPTDAMGSNLQSPLSLQHYFDVMCRPRTPTNRSYPQLVVASCLELSAFGASLLVGLAASQLISHDGLEVWRCCRFVE
jgi:hypothetical protein